MEQLKEQYIKYKLFIWPLATAVSFIVILALVLIPQVRGYLTDQGKIGEITNKADGLTAKASELDKINEAVMKRNVDVALTVLPTTQNVPEAMVTLLDLIQRSGLVLKNTSYAASARGDTKNNFRLNVVVFGPISTVRDFLINLGEVPRVFQVDTIAVRFQPGQQVAEAEIPVTVFFEPDSGSGGSWDQPVPKLDEREQKLLAKLAQMVPQATATFETDTSSVEIGKADPFE